VAPADLKKSISRGTMMPDFPTLPLGLKGGQRIDDDNIGPQLLHRVRHPGQMHFKAMRDGPDRPDEQTVFIYWHPQIDVDHTHIPHQLGLGFLTPRGLLRRHSSEGRKRRMGRWFSSRNICGRSGALRPKR
jgi:hypothetical protein